MFGDLAVYDRIMASSEAKLLVPFGKTDREVDAFQKHAGVMGAVLTTFDRSGQRRLAEYKIRKQQNEIVVKDSASKRPTVLLLDASDRLETASGSILRFGATRESKEAFMAEAMRGGAKLIVVEKQRNNKVVQKKTILPSIVARKRYEYKYSSSSAAENGEASAKRVRVTKSEDENIVLSPAEHRIEIPTKNLQRRMCQYCNISKTNYTNTERFFTEEWSAMYPKLAAAVEYIMTRKHRILVLVHPNCGFKAVRETMNQLADPDSGITLGGDEDPNTLHPRCPDPWRLELVSARVPKGYGVVEEPPLCVGKTRLSVKDIIFREADDGTRNEKLEDEDAMVDSDDEDRSSASRRKRSTSEVDYAESLSEEEEDDDEEWSSEEDEEENDDGGDNFVPSDEDLEVLASTNIVSGKRDRRRKQRGGSEDDRVLREGTMSRIEFDAIRTKKFDPVIMDMRAVRTLAEDVTEQNAVVQEQQQRRRSGRTTRKNVDYAQTRALKTKYRVYMQQRQKQIAFEMIDASGETRFKVVYDIVENDVPEKKTCWSTLFEKTCSGQKEAFNEREIQTLVVNAHEFGEGVSFFGVREIILFNPALRYAEHKQWIGRALRSCDQPGKPLTITTFVAAGSSAMKTADEYAVERLRSDGGALDAAMHRIREQSIEYDPRSGKLLYEELPAEPSRRRKTHSQ